MYSVVETEIFFEGSKITSYGIKYAGGIIQDVTIDRQSLADFVDKLNLYELSEIHIMDAIYDFLD